MKINAIAAIAHAINAAYCASQGDRVPRASGDEPSERLSMAVLQQCSPRQRG